jgi:autotransporter-associated beta strand protein
MEIQSGGTVTNNGSYFNRLGPLTLSGGTLTSTGGDTTGYPGRTIAYMLTGTVIISEDSSISGAGAIFNGYNGSGLTFDVSAGRSLTLSPSILNSASPTWGQFLSSSILKTGSGSLTLTGSNTFSGGLTIDSGNLVANGGQRSLNRDATNAVTIRNGGTLTLASDNVFGIHSDTDTLNPIDIQTGGTLTNSGASRFNRLGPLTLSGGTLTSTSGHTAGAYTNGAWLLVDTVTVTENSTIAGIGGIFAGYNRAGLTINVSAGQALGVTPAIFDGVATAFSTYALNSTLTKLGDGTLTLSGANTYTGTTSINAGTLIAANNTALGATSGSTTVSNGATLSLPGGITTAEPITLNGAGVSNAGSLRNISGTNTVSGAITLATDSSVGIDSSTAALTLSGIIGESGGTRALTKLGDGTLTLSGANTYTGTTSINAGTLIASHATALGSTLGSTIVADGATLQLADGLSLAAEPLVLNGAGVSTVGSLVLENNNYSGTITLGTDSVRIGVNGSGISTLGAVSGNNKTLVIHQSGNSTLAQSAAANLDQLAFTGSTGIVQFTNPGNSIGILAADTGRIEFVNGSSLTIGTVNPTGITATGPVSISTETGDLLVNASITTTDASAQAIVLNSGRSASAGSATGGDIIFTPGVALSKGANGRALLYTGGISTSSITPSGVTFILGDSRFNADETTPNFRPIDITILNTPRTFAIYREQPIITVQADDKSKIFDYTAFPAAQLTATCTGCANGDLPTITYTGSAGSGSAVYIGSYPITATYDATNLEALGYTINNIRSSGSVYNVTAATLSIVPFPGYIPPPRETVERTSQIPIRYLIENMQPTQLKIVLADHPSLVSLFSPTLAKGNIRLAYQDGTAYREDIRLREGIVRDTIFFDAGKPSLTNEATRTLDSLLRTANRYNLSAVEVVGHTELPNSPEDALKLSEERAKVVSEYLQNRWSLDKRPAKITSLGRSYLQPISDNITYSGRARNRRTEVTITGISLE